MTPFISVEFYQMAFRPDHVDSRKVDLLVFILTTHSFYCVWQHVVTRIVLSRTISNFL
jgi:hypothetical protein